MNTRSVAWGDWDGDGDLDLAVAGGFVHIYRNSGVASFSLAWQSTQDTGATSVSWADWDEDGDLDLAVGNSTQANQVLRNDGGSLSQAWQAPEEATNTTSVAWGDYDRDGHPDLAVGNLGQLNRIYHNQEGSSLTLAWEAPVARNTHSVAWADWDGDSDLDLAVGNNYQHPNQVFRNDQGSFRLTWESGDEAGVWMDTNSVDWGDWDGDGDLDLAFGRGYYRFPQTNQVYENDMRSLRLAETTEGRLTTSISWGDWDNDGDLDLVAGNTTSGPWGGNVNQAFRNDSGALVLAWEPTNIPRDTNSVAWGDADADGDLDLAVGNERSNQVYLNTGSVSFNPTWQLAGDPAALGDYDGDGDLDCATGRQSGNARVYRNDEGTPRLVWESPDDGNGTNPAWGDWDGDGDLDLAIAGQIVRIYRNGGGAGFGLAWESTQDTGATSAAWADWDGDGDLDLAVGNEGQANQIYSNDRSGTLTAVWEAPVTSSTRSVAWGDSDGDGDLDLAVGNNEQANQIYRNDGRDILTLAWEAPVARRTRSIAWGDWDGDGDLDLAVGNYRQPNQVYRNDGGSIQLAWEQSGEETTTTKVTWGDWEGDGDLDLAMGSEKTGYPYPDRRDIIYRNDGGSLSLAWRSLPDEETQSSVTWGDWDGDGDLDLAAAGRILQNTLLGSTRLANTPPQVVVHRPGNTDDAFLFSTPEILHEPIVQIPFTLFDPEGDPVAAIIPEFSPNGGGQWLPATAAAGTATRNLATGRYVRRTAVSEDMPISLVDGGTVYAALSIPDSNPVSDLGVWLTITHTQNADLGAMLVSPGGVTVTLFSPGSLAGSNLTGTTFDDQAETSIIRSTAPYTRSHQAVEPLSKLNGQMGSGTWWLRLSDAAGGGTGQLAAWGLSFKTPPAQHVFSWRAEADLIKSDNVVFRLRAQPSIGPIQRPAPGSISPPFRVESPWYVKVVDDTGKPISGTVVYADSQPITRTVTGDSVTNKAGLLSPGPLETGTTLVALAQQMERPATRDAHDGWAYRIYLTNLALDTAGEPHPFVVSGPGEQRLVVRPNSPLIVFNIVVSIEWDADDGYLAIIEDAFRKASGYLYDVTDGQMAFGEVMIYDNAEHWADADFQISTKNTVRPYAFIGGLTSLDTAHAIRVGRFWSGSSGNEGNWDEANGYRTLIHEFGHYALYLHDEYFVRQVDANGDFVGQASAACTGVEVQTNANDAANASMMYYQYNASELADTDRWTTNCRRTEQARANAEPDWQTVLAHYGGEDWALNTPSTRQSVMAGPVTFPSHLLPFPSVQVHNAGSGGVPRELVVLGPDGRAFPNALVALYTTPYSYTIAVDQGLTDQQGRLTIYGALGGDTIQAASFDGAYGGALSVDASGVYTLSLSPTGSSQLAVEAGVSSPYLNLVPGSEGDSLLLEVHGAPKSSLPLNAVVIPAEGGGSPQSAALAYSDAKGAYAGQVSLAGVGLGSGTVQVSGVAGGQSVRINSTYNLMRILDAQASDLASEDGNLQLHLGAGSLLNHADAYAVMLPTGYVPGPPPSGMRVLGSAYEVRFSGAATGLTKPGVLRLYCHPTVMGPAVDPAVYRWDALAGRWERLDGEWIGLENSVAVAVRQFGIYALMAEEANTIRLPILVRP